MGVDVAIVVVVSVLAIAMHVVLFMLFRRWMDRDLALSFAGDDTGKRDYMLASLQRAREQGVKRRELPGWLELASRDYSMGAAG